LFKTDVEIFELLKQQVSRTFLKENTALSTDITQWKGDDIIKFQDDLLRKVKGRVSEKWFYNYFRNDIQKLPRIDMLNLLSEYVGDENWANFKHKYSKEKKKINYKVVALLLLLPLLVFGYNYFNITVLINKQVAFCFVDENAQPITDYIKLKVVLENNREMTLYSTSKNCISFDTKVAEIEVNINPPYHIEKTFTRQLDVENYTEEITLETDIYSLMLRHYSNSTTKDWKLRKEKLENLLADDVLIYQRWFGEDKGVEIYTKNDFILQMTVPTSLLKNIEIIEKEMKNGRIHKLGFKVNR